MKRYLLVLLLLASFVLAQSGCTGYWCCKKPKPQPPEVSCVDEAIGSFDPEGCLTRCRRQLGDSGRPEAICQVVCEDARERNVRLATARCVGDEDRDGVQDGADRCPGTEPGTPVNWRGCPDGDDDGVADDEDRCTDTPAATLVDLRGCETEVTCHEGQCEHGQPICSTPEECDRISEQPLELEVPKDVRDEYIRKVLRRRPHGLPCPGDGDPPSEPELLDPGPGISPVEVGPVSVTLFDGAPVAGDEILLAFRWEEVADTCEPVTYSLYVEFYHCHRLPGLVEPASYRNRGWCRWMPYLYESVSSPAYNLDFPIGELFYEIHRPFISELGWDPGFTGAFPIRYMPFWLSVRVIAHDGNGTPSGFGLHSEGHYLVLYSDDTTPLELLYEIPVAP